MFLLLVFTAALIWLISFIFKKSFRNKETVNLGYEEQWFGRGLKGSSEEDKAIHPFKINVSDEVLSDLKARLENTRHEESYEETTFEYGFHSNYLKHVVDYWKNQYQWKRQEEYLNQYPNFKTRIEGIDLHFIHVKPTIPEGKNLRVVPILMIHGWPGSFFEFYKAIPILTTAREKTDFVFEVICPSIPGFGFSESPHHKGFDKRAAARIFVTLMNRLGYSKFYIQGGDFGHNISVMIAKFYPEQVIGFHSNMFLMSFNLWNVIKYTLLHFLPFLITPGEYKAGFTFKEKVKMLLLETGYYHIQATKPDTIGCALADSPAGLAAYILEKYSTWTNRDNKLRPDGGLGKDISLDELLTNVIIYWINNNIKASVKLYKESISNPHASAYAKLPIPVPCGIALFPNELFVAPKMMISKKVATTLVSFTVMPKGGHFAAFEQPKLFADDVWKFAALTEKLPSFK